MSALMLAAQQIGMVGKLPPHKIVQGLLAKRGTPWHRRRRRHGLSALSHFAFGAGAGALFGWLSAATGTRRPASVILGSAYGAGIWAIAYGVVLPATGLMPWPGGDRPGRQEVMAAAHLVYGGVLGALTDPGPDRDRDRSSTR
jgi:hypothetical protein